jgi:hypothetical protein
VADFFVAARDGVAEVVVVVDVAVFAFPFDLVSLNAIPVKKNKGMMQ